MSTMNISPSETLKSFVHERVVHGSYETISEYVRELTRKDQDRLHLGRLLLQGASSPPDAPADAACFAKLRDRARHRAAG